MKWIKAEESEAAICRCSSKYVLKILQCSLENACVGISF